MIKTASFKRFNRGQILVIESTIIYSLLRIETKQSSSIECVNMMNLRLLQYGSLVCERGTI